MAIILIPAGIAVNVSAVHALLLLLSLLSDLDALEGSTKLD